MAMNTHKRKISNITQKMEIIICQSQKNFNNCIINEDIQKNTFWSYILDSVNRYNAEGGKAGREKCQYFAAGPNIQDSLNRKRSRHPLLLRAAPRVGHNHDFFHPCRPHWLRSAEGNTTAILKKTGWHRMGCGIFPPKDALRASLPLPTPVKELGCLDISSRVRDPGKVGTGQDATALQSTQPGRHTASGRHADRPFPVPFRGREARAAVPTLCPHCLRLGTETPTTYF